jgi:hypothetical protein
MQTSQVVSQPGVFPFDTGHVSFADNLVAVGNKAGIDCPAIGDIKIALPSSDNRPKRCKGDGTMIP